MPSRKELKLAAKGHIKGNILTMFLCLIVLMILTSVTMGLFAPALAVGLCLIYINMTQGVKPSVGDLFNRTGTFGKALWLSIITAFFTMLWSYLLLVPGIIKGLSYSMGPYIMAEHPDWTARQCLTESKRIMKGNVGKLFVLILSFIPWFLLCGVTFGIAYIYVIPYMEATIAGFYNSIKNRPLEQPQAVPA